MKNFTKLSLSLLAVAIILAADSAFAQSCPMCKESMTAAGAKLSDGFYYSIMSMFSIPVTMIGAGTVFVAMNSWKKRNPDAVGYSTLQVMKAMMNERKERSK